MWTSMSIWDLILILFFYKSNIVFSLINGQNLTLPNYFIFLLVDNKSLHAIS